MTIAINTIMNCGVDHTFFFGHSSVEFDTKFAPKAPENSTLKCRNSTLECRKKNVFYFFPLLSYPFFSVGNSREGEFPIETLSQVSKN
mgnify:CR=1 FL=1